MDTINISLPDNLKDFATAQVAGGDFGSVSEYVSALIAADQKQKAKAVVEAAVLKGLESGPAIAMLADEWQSLREEVRDRHARRKNA